MCVLATKIFNAIQCLILLLLLAILSIAKQSIFLSQITTSFHTKYYRDDLVENICWLRQTKDQEDSYQLVVFVFWLNKDKKLNEHLLLRSQQ